MDISGTIEGVKFDRIETIDLDGDGDLDVLTCEERDNLASSGTKRPDRGNGVLGNTVEHWSSAAS